MAPREATHSYPDHFLTTDYYDVNAPMDTAGFDGGLGGFATGGLTADGLGGGMNAVGGDGGGGGAAATGDQLANMLAATAADLGLDDVSTPNTANGIPTSSGGEVEPAAATTTVDPLSMAAAPLPTVLQTHQAVIQQHAQQMQQLQTHLQYMQNQFQQHHYQPGAVMIEEGASVHGGGAGSPHIAQSYPASLGVASNVPAMPTSNVVSTANSPVESANEVSLPTVVTPAVSRSNSVASSLTASVNGWVGLNGSVNSSSGGAAAASYRRSVSNMSTMTNPQAATHRGLLQSYMEELSPIQSPSYDEQTANNGAPSTPNGSNEGSSGVASSSSGGSPKGPSMSPDDLPKSSIKVSPLESTAPHSSSPSGAAAPHSPGYSPLLAQVGSVLDQTSFPDDDMDDAVADGLKLNLNESFGSVKKTDVTADTTMDTTVNSPTNNNLGVSHIINENSHLMADAPSTPTSSSLRPRPSPFASHSHSASSGSIGNGLVRNEAFEMSPGVVVEGTQQATLRQYHHQVSDVSTSSALSFGTETTITDLTYYAERGAIVDVLSSLSNPHLKTLGTRMLADYAKMPHRRVAVASNAKILEFVQSTALEIGLYQSNISQEEQNKYTSSSWFGREYAVETVRSLTAAEENDRYLMNSPGLLQMLALVARGGPFVQKVQGRFGEEMIVAVPPPPFGALPEESSVIGVASDKARLHACIAIMNLSCGKSNKVEITNVPEILEAMRDVMQGRYFSKPPKTSSSAPASCSTLADEARLKATTCIKNLSNSDANDAALLGTRGLVETLGSIAEATCHPKTGATTCTTHACLALMNLSISKANKNRVFRTPGVMDALMAVITRTAKTRSAERGTKDPSFEARVKACSALSNLAIGYDNKIPMFHYPGFVESILTVIRTDNAEARTKACSILWSFAAEMKNQVPVSLKLRVCRQLCSFLMT